MYGNGLSDRVKAAETRATGTVHDIDFDAGNGVALT